MKARLGMLVLAFVLVAVGAARADDTVVEVIPLKNRSAEDVVPALQALAGPDGVVTAMGTRLVVRASPAALAQIKRVIEELDTPPRSLWITVEQSMDRAASARGAEVEVRHGTSVERRTSRTVVTGSFATGRSEESGADVQRLRVLEGSRAFIRTGRAVPVAQAQVVPFDGSVAVVQGTAYQEADSGFYVVPRVSGDHVTLEISTRGDRLDEDGAIDVQRIETTVSGRLGEWMSLGGVGRRQDGRDSGILAGSGQQATESRTLRLKVEEAP